MVASRVALLLASPVIAAGALLRSGNVGRPVQVQDSEKLEQLLKDIDESVRKASSDAELVFARVLTYDQQLEASVKREMDAMNTTLVKLDSMKNSFSTEIKHAQGTVDELSRAERRSQQNATKYQEKSKKVNNKFGSLFGIVADTISFLDSATVNEDGHLMASRGDTSMRRPSKVINTVRQVLAAERSIEKQFPDVFEAFSPLPKANLALLLDPKKVKRHEKEQSTDDVRLSVESLRRTVAALQMIQANLGKQQSQILLQFEAHQSSLANHATSARANEVKAQGLEAEQEHQAEEVTFALSFAKSLLELDEHFYEQVSSSVETKADLVDKIRKSRNVQSKTLRDLIDLLSGKFSIEDSAAAQEKVALLETSAKHQVRRQPGGALEFEAETAIRNHRSTHSILMRIKSMLNSAAPVDADNVQSVVSDLNGVLREVGSEQSGSEEARQRCKAQAEHAKREKEELKVNLELMKVVQNHTRSAILAAKENLRGITAKTAALKATAKDFTSVTKQSVATLKTQNGDRATIMAAVSKATRMAQKDNSKTTGAAASALLEQLSKSLEGQDKSEGAYRQQEQSLRVSFVAYARNYVQLLKERKRHYEGSLSALELYQSEVKADTTAQIDSLRTGNELEEESQALCDSITGFYSRHQERRQELSASLRAVLPKVPALMANVASSEEPQNSDAHDAGTDTQAEDTSDVDNSDDIES